MERTRRSTWIIPALAVFPWALAPGAQAETLAAATVGGAVADEDAVDDETKLAQATTDTAEPAPEGESASTPDATVSEDAKAPPKKKDEKKKGEATDSNLNPALQPGGIVANTKAFPLHITASLTQSVGSGFLSPGHSAVLSLPTNLSLRPSFNVPELFDWQPRMVLTGNMALDIDWASNSQGAVGASTADRQLRVSDPAIGLLFPGLVKLGFMNTSMTPILRAVAPLSVASRFNNRLAGFGGAAQTMYMQPLGPFGTFIGIYTPSATGWTFTDDASTVRCGESLNAGGGLFGSGNPVDASTDFPLAVARPEEFTDDAGNCKVRGRQIVASLVNSLAAVYSIGDPLGGNHNVAVSVGTWHAFLRPLAERPELRGEYAAPQSYVNFLEWTFGDISYSYSLPTETSVTLTTGISSLQPMWTNTADGTTGQVLPRLPWFDLNILNGRGSNNFTSGYLNLTVAL